MHIPFVDLKSQYKTIQKEIDEVMLKVASSGNFIKGPFLEDFETKFAEFSGNKYAVGTASGTEALHLSLLALGMGPDNEVIIPANTFIASAYAVMYTGAKPVLVDADLFSYNIDSARIEQSITKKTKAIMVVHLYGQPANMTAIKAIANKYNLKIIEDACQAHGALYKNKKIGSFGDISAFSFYPGKNLGAYGDGGMIVTNSFKYFQKLVRLREYGSSSKYIHENIGYNSRLDALQAAILTIKLKHLSAWNKKRNNLALRYSKLLNKELPFIITPSENSNSYHVYHLYVIRTPKRNKLFKFLLSNNIQTGIHYPIPLPQQKSLAFLGHKKGDFQVSEKLSKEIISLPIYPELTHNAQDYIVEKIRSFYK